LVHDNRETIDDLELDDGEKKKLIIALNLVWQNLREKDYEDTGSITAHWKKVCLWTAYYLNYSVEQI
jgi:hypothetical protein